MKKNKEHKNGAQPGRAHDPVPAEDHANAYPASTIISQETVDGQIRQSVLGAGAPGRNGHELEYSVDYITGTIADADHHLADGNRQAAADKLNCAATVLEDLAEQVWQRASERWASHYVRWEEGCSA